MWERRAASCDGLEQKFFLHAEFARFAVRHQRVGDTAKCSLNGLLVNEQRRLLPGLGQTNSRAEPAPCKDGLCQRCAEAPRSRGPGEQIAQGRTLKSTGGTERNLRKISGARNSDLGMRRNQLLFCLSNVRAALKQRRGKPGRNFGGLALFGKSPAAWDITGILTEQNAEKVFLSLDLLLQHRH